MESDGKQLDADTVKDVLNFVDATTGEEGDVAVVAEDMKEGLAGEVGVETEATQADPVLKMVRELNRVGCGIREQCKLITDLTYEMESLDCGQYVLEELTGLYRYLYQNGQEHRGLPHLRKEHLRHRPLFKSKHKRGFFHRRRIVPLYPTKIAKSGRPRLPSSAGEQAKNLKMLRWQYVQRAITTWKWWKKLTSWRESHRLLIWRPTRARMTGRRSLLEHQVC